MGLSSKQVTGDQGLDWTSEMSKPPPSRRQQPPQRQSEPLKCPRCASTNTKFCYYNNYNKSQPRHFCKSCKRHWTKGGTLRNVPVGGGRKNKRPKIPNAAAAAAPPKNFPVTTNNCEEKSVSNLLYQALHETKPFINGVTAVSTGLNISAPQNINSEFQFTNLSTFEEGSSNWINPISYQALNTYDHHYTGNLDSIDGSTITTVNDPCTSYMPWLGPNTSSGLDLPNYWNWNEIDVSGDLNIAWDDDNDDDHNNAEIKP